MPDRVQEEFKKLVDVIATLRSPSGCPWDREQDHKSLRKCLIEEAYEAVDAIDQDSPQKIEEELGDVLLQVVLHAQIASEDSKFDIADVCRTIREKLIRRHPHVFGDIEVAGVDEVLHNWQEIKAKEPGKAEIKSAIGGVPKCLPALMRASEISKRAARTGFEWPDMQGVLDKLQEETVELHEAIESNDNNKVKHEIGDLLFTVVNIARWAKIDAEESLREMLDRFQTRFTAIEDHARETGRSIGDLTLNEMNAIWEKAKKG